jgi:type 1 glutamine amidotransferase
MKLTHLLRSSLLVLGLALPALAAAEPKKLLVVTVTTGFRHSSIETAEKVLKELGEKSGAWTVDFVHQPGRPAEEPRQATGEEERNRRGLQSQAGGLQQAAMAEYNMANDVWNAKIKAYMTEQMALEKIKGYDGFVFANTTGDLLFPDRDGFVELIKSGKAMVAMHSGSDTYHPFRGYIDMLGGEFETHKSQVEVQPILHDPAHAATKPIPAGFKVYDEIYIIKTFDKSKVHALMGLEAHPNLAQLTDEEKKKEAELKRYFPISWCKEFGQGRVFYSSLGHREDVWDPTWKEGTKDRKNSPEIAKIYQDHILGGIKWALRLAEGDGEAGNLK